VVISLYALPTLNAVLNAASACLLVLGLALIRARRIAAHRRTMVAACLTSLVFFISYLTYHVQVGTMHFPGQGRIRLLYLAILTTHTILAIVIVPLVLRTLWLALRQRFDAHRRIARWTWPLWMYVSVTGVVVYWFLYHSRWHAVVLT